MHADAARRIPELGGDRRDREGRGVGREDGLRTDHVFELGEEQPLGLQVFDNRFDDETGAAQIVEGFAAGQPGQDCCTLRRRQTLAVDAALQRRADTF